MPNDKNKNNKNKNIRNKSEKESRRPLPQGNIIGKRPEIFNLTYKNMFEDDSSN